MNAKIETTPYGGDPDEFDLVISDVYEQRIDPYLANVHKIGEECLTPLRTEYDEDSPSFTFAKAQYEEYVNSQWNYSGRPLLVTGNVWKSLPAEENTDRMVRELCIDTQAISRGFMFYTDKSIPKGNPERIKVAHCLEIPTGDGDTMPAALCLDDIMHIELPEASKELREQRFQYYFPEQAKAIDALVDVPREDQAFVNLSNFYMDINFKLGRDVDFARDCAQYLRSKVTIEPQANYRMTLLGEVIIIDKNGNGHPATLEKRGTYTTKINDIAFRPADTTLMKFEGWQFCVPYIDMTIFNPDGRDISALLPLTSIIWMHSLRYNGMPTTESA